MVVCRVKLLIDLFSDHPHSLPRSSLILFPARKAEDLRRARLRHRLLHVLLAFDVERLGHLEVRRHLVSNLAQLQRPCEGQVMEGL